MKSSIKSYTATFRFFYRYLGYRMFVMLALTMAVGVLDGFGLAMFLPLLEFVATPEEGSVSRSLGNLAFITEGFERLGLTLTLTTVLLIILGFFSLKGVFKFLAVASTVVYKQRFVRSLRKSNILAFAGYPYIRFLEADAGRIQNSLSSEVGRVTSAYQYYVRLIQQGLLVLVYGGLAFVANAQFALLVAVGGIATNVAFTKIYAVTKRLSRDITRDNHGFHRLLIQQVAFFKYLKATGLLPQYAKKLIQKVELLETTQRKIGLLGAIMQGIREPLLIAVVVGVVIIQVQFLGGSLGLIILSILFFYRALTAVMSFQVEWNKFLAVSGSLENIQAFTHELTMHQEVERPNTFDRLASGISVESASLTLGKTAILNDVSLDIRRNETIALVGESGSGKTSFINLLCGLLPPNKGCVKVDGVDLQQLNLSTYQQRIGYITQEPVIFNDTIFNNVTFFAEPTEANRALFDKALARAHLAEFVQNCPQREQSLLGNNGINLSGGQKQRIAIARELFKEVDILLMDEATSALDTATEREIKANIDELKGQYTIVIVAHRLSTIRNVDRVVVFNKGRIESIASYDELLTTSTAFQRMVQLQEIGATTSIESNGRA